MVKTVNSFPGDTLVQITKLIFAEYGFPNKIVSDVGINFTLETFNEFCKKVDIQENKYIIIPPQRQWTGGGVYKIC